MGVPTITFTERDNALGLVTSSDDAILVLGTCSAGTALTSGGPIYSFSNPSTIPGTLGYGPLADAAAYLALTTGGPIYAGKLPSTTAGAAGSVTQVGTGTGVVTVTGDAADVYNVVVTITTAGASPSAMKFTYTLNGGETDALGNSTVVTSQVINGASTYAIPNTGLTLAFGSGTYVAGDTFSFTTTAPTYSQANLTAALAAVQLDPRGWRYILVLGGTTYDSTNTTQITTLDAALQTMRAANKYTAAIGSARDIGIKSGETTEALWMAGLITDAASSTSSLGLVSVVAGYGSIFMPLTQTITASGASAQYMRRPLGLAVAARALRSAQGPVPIAQDAGWIGAGTLPYVNRLYHDERAVPGLDAVRYATCMSWPGRGLYVTKGPRTEAPAGSDYGYLPYRLVMNRAETTVQLNAAVLLNSSVRTRPSNVTINPGGIDERDARPIEGQLAAALNAVLYSQDPTATSVSYPFVPGPPASGATASAVWVDRSVNLLATGVLKVWIRLAALGYVRDVAVDIGFQSIATAAVGV